MAHWLLWEFIQRPIVAAHRFAVFKHRKLLAGVGVLLVSASFPSVRDKVGTLLQRARAL
jgi:hypothetical protein